MFHILALILLKEIYVHRYIYSQVTHMRTHIHIHIYIHTYTLYMHLHETKHAIFITPVSPKNKSQRTKIGLQAVYSLKDSTATEEAIKMAIGIKQLEFKYSTVFCLMRDC